MYGNFYEGYKSYGRPEEIKDERLANPLNSRNNDNAARAGQVQYLVSAPPAGTMLKLTSI